MELIKRKPAVGASTAGLKKRQSRNALYPLSCIFWRTRTKRKQAYPKKPSMVIAGSRNSGWAKFSMIVTPLIAFEE